MHRLQPGLPGYLIPFAPLAFASQRQLLPSSVLSPSVFLLISTDFTPTPGVPAASAQLKIYSFNGTSRVEPGSFTTD